MVFGSQKMRMRFVHVKLFKYFIFFSSIFGVVVTDVIVVVTCLDCRVWSENIVVNIKAIQKCVSYTKKKYCNWWRTKCFASKMIRFVAPFIVIIIVTVTTFSVAFFSLSVPHTGIRFHWYFIVFTIRFIASVFKKYVFFFTPSFGYFRLGFSLFMLT